MCTEIKPIWLVHGVNLGVLERRNANIYGVHTLKDIEMAVKERAASLDCKVETFQFDSEYEIIKCLHDAYEKAEGIIINPGAYTHTSIAIRDALEMLKCPIMEVHLTNIHRREEFRRHSYVSGVADGVICGIGVVGYLAAVEYIVGKIRG